MSLGGNGLCCFVYVGLWLWCQVVFVWLFLFSLCVKYCCSVVLLCLVCRWLVVFCVIVCVVAVMYSFVGVVRVVGVVNSYGRMYVGLCLLCLLRILAKLCCRAGGVEEFVLLVGFCCGCSCMFVVLFAASCPYCNA